jgi:hypothetical protein
MANDDKVKLLITSETFFIEPRATAHLKKKGIDRGYGSAKVRPVSLAGWSDRIYFLTVVSLFVWFALQENFEQVFVLMKGQIFEKKLLSNDIPCGFLK